MNMGQLQEDQEELDGLMQLLLISQEECLL